MISCCSCKLQRLALCGRDLASTRRHITIQQASPSASGLFKNLNVKRSTITRATASNSADVERWPVSIVEVGPRDGLQNEPSAVVPTDIKVGLIDRLSGAGCSYIEAASFVSPKWVPQMADGRDVMERIRRAPGVKYAALTPNEKGLAGALASKADEVAVFAAASEAFSMANINCSVQESLERFKPVMARAATENVPVRGYVSCVMGCPFEGVVAPQDVVKVTQSLFEMGCYSVSLGDTVGAGTAGSTGKLLEAMRQAGVPTKDLAVHFHDTFGQALANILVALDEGVTVIDSAVSGLGGCPYAPGAGGNVATEDVLYMLEGLGVQTGIDFELLLEASSYISEHLQRPPQSRVARAISARRDRRCPDSGRVSACIRVTAGDVRIPPFSRTGHTGLSPPRNINGR